MVEADSLDAEALKAKNARPRDPKTGRLLPRAPIVYESEQVEPFEVPEPGSLEGREPNGQFSEGSKIVRALSAAGHKAPKRKRLFKDMLETLCESSDRARELLEGDIQMSYKGKTLRGRPDKIIKDLVFMTGDPKLVMDWYKLHYEQAFGRPAQNPEVPGSQKGAKNIVEVPPVLSVDEWRTRYGAKPN